MPVQSFRLPDGSIFEMGGTAEGIPWRQYKNGSWKNVSYLPGGWEDGFALEPEAVAALTAGAAKEPPSVPTESSPSWFSLGSVLAALRYIRNSLRVH